MQANRQIRSKARFWGKRSWWHPGLWACNMVFVGILALGIGAWLVGTTFQELTERLDLAGDHGRNSWSRAGLSGVSQGST